ERQPQPLLRPLVTRAALEQREIAVRQPPTGLDLPQDLLDRVHDPPSPPAGAENTARAPSPDRTPCPSPAPYAISMQRRPVGVRGGALGAGEEIVQRADVDGLAEDRVDERQAL